MNQEKGCFLCILTPMFAATALLFFPSQKFDFLDPSYGTASSTDVRNVLHSSDPSVAFIGFVRPGVGAIPPIAEMQAMFWDGIISGRRKIPEDEDHYHLLQGESARIRYGVDHGA